MIVFLISFPTIYFCATSEAVARASISSLVDEEGTVIEEYWKKKTRTVETYYYYYDASKNLTDIVRFNSKAKKLLPDAVYEYNANHQLMKAMQVSAEGRSVVYWEYTYNNKGLKESETARDKEQRMLGKIVYSYEWAIY